MEVLWNNTKRGRGVIFFLLGSSLALQLLVGRPMLLYREMFGIDGNGGSVTKIITDLTDEEIARLKFVRRMNWHWRGNRRWEQGRETISDRELQDRGIEVPKDNYIEYLKRPPHDKYL